MRTRFVGANLIDGHSPAVAGQSIVVEDDRIVAVGDPGEVVGHPEDDVVDLAGKTLMPGMYSCHFHASFDGEGLDTSLPLGLGLPPGYLMLRAARAARTALYSGFTGVAGAGNAYDIDAQLKLAIEDGLVEGPRMLAGSHNLGTRSGYVDLGSWWWDLGNTGAQRLADGADEFRKLARQEIKRGAEILKVFATGGHGNRDDGTTELSHDELSAVVETAHERGKKVRAHCSWKRTILECAQLGLDVIDHGDQLDEECIDAMVEGGTFLVPSLLYLEKLLTTPDAIPEDRAEFREASIGERENMLEALPRANAAGMKIVLGDDYGTVFLPHGSYAQEMEFYVKQVGIPALDVIRWATVNGAELLGLGDQLGCIEAGKLADLLVVDGDPSVDIGLLQDPARLLAIMKDGRIVKNDLGKRNLSE